MILLRRGGGKSFEGAGLVENERRGVRDWVWVIFLGSCVVNGSVDMG